MAGVVVCHGSATVRERLVVTSIGVPSLAPVRAAATADELLALARRIAPTVVLLDAVAARPTRRASVVADLCRNLFANPPGI